VQPSHWSRYDLRYGYVPGDTNTNPLHGARIYLQMGGYNGEVRGGTKIETYLKYIQRCESWELDHNPEPKNKKYCKRQMEWDPERKHWVLKFRFSN
jgi:hypothetical protein